MQSEKRLRRVHHHDHEATPQGWEPSRRLSGTTGPQSWLLQHRRPSGRCNRRARAVQASGDGDDPHTTGIGGSTGEPTLAKHDPAGDYGRNHGCAGPICDQQPKDKTPQRVAVTGGCSSSWILSGPRAPLRRAYRTYWSGAPHSRRTPLAPPRVPPEWLHRLQPTEAGGI